MGFYEGGLARYANGRFEEIANDLPKSLITDLHLDKRGRLWFASSIGGLFRLDDTSADEPQFVSLTTENGLSSNNVRTITEDRFGRIYLGTARGVDRISPDLGLVKHYSNADGLASDFVVDSHCDKNGALWFATSGGLSRLAPQPNETVAAPTVRLGGLRIAGTAQPISQLGDKEVDKGELTYTEIIFKSNFLDLIFARAKICVININSKALTPIGLRRLNSARLIFPICPLAVTDFSSAPLIPKAW